MARKNLYATQEFLQMALFANMADIEMDYDSPEMRHIRKTIQDTVKALKTKPFTPPTITVSSEVIELCKKQVLLENFVFSIVVAKNPAVMSEIYTAVTGKPVKVLASHPQKALNNIEGRSVVLDSFDELEFIGEPGGHKVFGNCEAQVKNDDDHVTRMSYNACMIKTSQTPEGAQFADVPNVISILLSAYDPFKEGKILYEFSLRGDHIYCVNSAVRKPARELRQIQDPALQERVRNIQALLLILSTSNCYSFSKFPHLSKVKKDYANGKGVKEVSEELQRYIDLKIEQATEAANEQAGKAFAALAEIWGVSIDEAIRRIEQDSNKASAG